LVLSSGINLPGREAGSSSQSGAKFQNV
jgi:hypothetical protein